jgi:capsid assembly protease
MSDQPVRRISRFIKNHPWAILPDKHEAICELVDLRMRGVTFSEDEVRARIGAAMRPTSSVVDAVAVIPLYGVIAQKMNAMTAISGGTSIEQFMASVRAAFADGSIKAIVVDCDSPGGTVTGVLEAADELFTLKGRSTKTLTFAANPMIASAAYWLASQADEVVCMPSGEVGSVGVFMCHDDVSAANQKAGYKPTYIYAGEHKVETNPDEPLSDDARAYLQKQVDAMYGSFVKAVARGRRASAAAVQKTFGQGRMLMAQDALAAGMIDRVETLAETVARLVRNPRTAGASASMAVAGMTSAELNEFAAQLAAKARLSETLAGIVLAGVIPHDISEKLAPKDTPWSAPTLADFTDKAWSDLTDAEKNRIAEHYAWAKMMPPATFGDLKLPHHRYTDGAVVFRGVVAALGRLDAMSDVPAADKPHIKAHLEHHEAQFAAQEKSSARAAATVQPGDMPNCEICTADCPCLAPGDEDPDQESAPGCPTDCPTCLPECACTAPTRAKEQAIADEAAILAALIRR